MGSNVSFHSCHGKGARGFRDGTGIFKDVLDRRADFVVVDADDAVDVVPAYAEAFFSNNANSGTVGEETYFVEQERGGQRRGIEPEHHRRTFRRR